MEVTSNVPLPLTPVIISAACDGCHGNVSILSSTNNKTTYCWASYPFAHLLLDGRCDGNEYGVFESLLLDVAIFSFLCNVLQISKATLAILSTLSTIFEKMVVVSISGNTCTDKKAAAINMIEGN